MAERRNVATVEQWIADGETRVTKLLLHRERERLAGLSTQRLDARVEEFEDRLAEWRQLRLQILRHGAIYADLPLPGARERVGRQIVCFDTESERPVRRLR